MNFFRIIFSLFFLSLSCILFGQDKSQFLIRKEWKYQYQHRVYNKSQVASILKENKLASQIYQRHLKTKSNGNILCITSLVIGAASLNTKLIYQNDLALGVGVTAFIATGFMGIMVRAKSKAERKRAIEIFNYGISQTDPKVGSIPELNLQFSSAGLGICYIF